MTTHRKSLLPTGFLLKKSNGTQNIYPRTRGHHWPVCLLSCFCSLYFSLQKSYGIISNIAATRLPDFHRQRRFRHGAYLAGQAAPASRLRVQRYGEIQPHARKQHKKVWKFVSLQVILGYSGDKTQENGLFCHIFTRTITGDHGRHGELYNHTDYHGCPRTPRRIICLHELSRMYTDDTEDYIITRTNADVHGQCGGLYFHTDDHGWPRRTFESFF